MKLERSCGAVVFTRKDHRILFIIVQEMGGAYSFPKGHMEGNETETETAQREVFEEIGLKPAFIPGFRQEDEYDLKEKPGTRKRVTYFLAEYQGEPLTPRAGEIRGIELLPYEQAVERFNNKSTKNILDAAVEFLNSLGLQDTPVSVEAGKESAGFR